MNDAVLIQHVYSGSPYREGIRLAFARHFDYCGRHAMDYNLVERDVMGWPPSQGGWAKVVLIDNLLTQYQYVFYVDADAAIWDMGVDLREAFNGTHASILAARHPGPPTHLNVGVMFFRSGDAGGMSKFFGAWLDARPGGPPWWEQTVFNCLAADGRFAGIVERMDGRWNSTFDVNESPRPVIRAWHGGWALEQKMSWMREALGVRC